MLMIFEPTVLDEYGFPYFTVFGTYSYEDQFRGKMTFLIR